MREIIDSELFMLILNMSALLLGRYLVGRIGLRYISPLVIAIVAVSLTITLLDIDYEVYNQGSRMLNYMLAPSVVALGYLLHKNIDSIKAYLLPIVVSVTLGVVVNVVVINSIMLLLGADLETIYAVQPKSITTPIAISLSEGIGVSVPITIMSVVSTGLFGSIIGLPIMKLLGIKNPIAIGAAFGSSAHAIGTSMALKVGALEGAVSGFTIALTGVITAVVLPIISNLFL